MEAPKLFSRLRIDLLLISSAADVLKRSVQISEKFKISSFKVASFEDYEINCTDIGRPNLILVDMSMCVQSQEAIDRLQKIQNFIVPKCDVVCIVPDTVDAAYLSGLKAAGAYDVMPLSQATGSVRLDFVILYKFLLSYYPIEIKDLFPGTEISFHVFHFLKLNNKYLPVIFDKFVLSEKKFARLETVNPLFVRRNDVAAYQAYIENFYDAFKGGLLKRIKASFLNLLFDYSQVIELAIFGRTLKKGDSPEALLKRVGENQIKFNNYLIATQSPMYSLYQQYLQIPLLSFDRSALMIAMASLISKMSGVGDPAKVAQIGALTYVGLSSLDQLAYLKWLTTKNEQWTDVEKEHFAKYLIQSVLMCKTSFQSADSSLFTAVSAMSERFDGQGIPGRISGEDIPAETAILQFTERWLRSIDSQKDISLQLFELSFEECLTDDKVSGRVNPKFIEPIQQLLSKKAA